MRLPKRRLFHFTSEQVRSLLRNAPRIYRKTGFDVLRSPATHPWGRLLVIIPARIANAVTRNAIRRRLKEIFRTNALDKSAYDYVIIVNKNGLSLTFEQWQTHLLRVADMSCASLRSRTSPR